MPTLVILQTCTEHGMLPTPQSPPLAPALTIQRAVLAEGRATQGHSAVVAQGVGVDQHVPLALQAALAVQLQVGAARQG